MNVFGFSLLNLGCRIVCERTTKEQASAQTVLRVTAALIYLVQTLEEKFTQK